MILQHELGFANPDLCRRLWELGVSTETVHVWNRENDDPLHLGWSKDNVAGEFGELNDGIQYSMYPAYSVAELGELLRARTKHCEAPFSEWPWDDGGIYMCPEWTGYATALTEADARAILLLHLLGVDSGRGDGSAIPFPHELAIHIIEQQRKEG